MTVKAIHGDCRTALPTLAAESVQCVVTSPPYYGLRDYRVDGQIGLEPSPDEYVAQLVAVFRELRRVLRPDGVCFLNLGDSYNNFRTGQCGQSVHGHKVHDQPVTKRRGVTGFKEKDLLLIPHRVASALQADGWWLRSVLPWVKRSCMPESCNDRPTNAIEYVFLLAKSERYFWDREAVQKKGAIAAGTRAAKGSNVRSELKDVNGRPPEYWDYTGTRNFRNSDLFFESISEPFGLICDENGEPIALDVNPEPFPEAHFATYPPALVMPLIKAGSSERGCCPSCGAPWERVVEKGDPDLAHQRACGSDENGQYFGQSTKGHEAAGVQDASDVKRRILAGMVEKRTTDWRPTCECQPADPVPCTVLDPFSGAGTTGMVADRLGRNAVLIELNPEYSRMGADRIRDDAPLFAQVAAE